MPNKNAVLKLTWLWAFVEAGLGGLLHFFHVPVTGLVIGGFAVIIIILIAKYSGNHFGTMVNALLIVLAIKFILSPFSPFGAYVAVGFQGLLGAIIFSIFGTNKGATIAFSIVVMVESAIQKPLMALLILGNNFWKAAVLFLQNTFSLNAQSIQNAAVLLFIVYVLLYIFWGIMIAVWANYIKRNIETISIDKDRIESMKTELLTKQKAGNKARVGVKKILLIGSFLVIVALFIVSGLLSPTYLIRIAVVLLIFVVVIPFLMRQFQQFLLKKNYESVSIAIKATPIIKNNTIIAYQLTRPLGSFKKIRNFILYAIWLNVFYEPQ